jgi:hypothetical protein
MSLKTRLRSLEKAVGIGKPKIIVVVTVPAPSTWTRPYNLPPDDPLPEHFFSGEVQVEITAPPKEQWTKPE